jgi:hypothetical protein
MTVEPANLVRVDFGGVTDDIAQNPGSALARVFFGPSGDFIYSASGTALKTVPGAFLREGAYLFTAPWWKNKKQFLDVWYGNPSGAWQALGPLVIITAVVAYVLFRIVEGSSAKISPAMPTVSDIGQSLRGVV